MPRYIVKLNGLYAEWSTVVDAPGSSFMPLADFEKYYEWKYGLESLAGLPARMARVEQTGTSSMLDASVESLISGNRAGCDEDELTIDELVQKYAASKTPHQ
jgi:hypothetical protein